MWSSWLGAEDLANRDDHLEEVCSTDVKLGLVDEEAVEEAEPEDIVLESNCKAAGGGDF